MEAFLVNLLVYRRCGAERDRTADLLNAIVGLPTHIVELTGFPCQNRVTTFTFELIWYFIEI